MGFRRSARDRGRVLIGVVLIALVLAACSSGDETAVGPPASGDTASTAQPVREYPGGGPVDRIFPPDDHAYELLGAGSCDTLLQKTNSWGNEVVSQVGNDTVRVYRSAALACLGRWEDAKAELQAVDVNNPQFSGQDGDATPEKLCARAAVLKWVTALVHEWDQDHSFSPEFTSSTKEQPCSPSSSSSTSSTSSSSTSSTSSTTTTSK